MLVEDPAIAVAEEVELQTLQLEAGGVGDIVDEDSAEIGLSRLGTDGREFRAGDLDLIVSARELVGKGFHQGRHVDSSARVVWASRPRLAGESPVDQAPPAGEIRQPEAAGPP